MSVSAQPDLPPTRLTEHIVLPTTDEEEQVISKAAALLGWTVPEYVLCAVLDRAERDLYTHATLGDDPQGPPPEGAAGPLTALIGG